MVNPRFVIKAVISGQRLNINVPLTVSGTVNYIGVEAKCTSEWDGCTIVGYILQPSTGYYAQMALIYDQEKDLYYFPNAERLTLSAGEWDIWFVGIVAENGQEKYRVTTETRVFTVYANEFEKRLPQGNITLDEEAIARATDAQNKANLVLDLYNSGKLTGPKGDPGDPAEIGFVQASVDSTTDNPRCAVTVTENPENTYNMQFAFSGIKGAKGDTGATGPKGDTGAQGAPGRDGTDGRDGEDGRTIDDYVLVQAEQPTSETNKMWLKPTASGDPILIPSAEEFQEVIGSTTFSLDSSVLSIKYPVIYASDLSIRFDSPAAEINNNYVTELIPLPVTLDGKITHNGYGYSNYKAIVFYDNTKTPIGSDANSHFAPIVTTIPDNAAYFRLRYYGADPHGLQISFNLSVAEKANYLRVLMNTEPDKYIYDFDAPNILTLAHTEILASNGAEIYSETSGYSASDFILLPDDIELIGTYAYTSSARARVAFYNANKEFISPAYASGSKRLMGTAVPEGAVFVRFSTHTTVPPSSCLAIGLIKVTKSNDEIINMIRQALI